MPDAAQSSHPGASQLAAYAQGTLAGAEQAALQDHLKACPACRQALTALTTLPAGGESENGRDTLATTGAPRGESESAPRPGAMASRPPGSAVPADLANHPRYEVLQLLGQGGMGAVYKARHKKMDRLVALKVINATLLNHPKAVERFQREVKAAAKLEHPNIVRAYDADEAGGTHFLVMEFVEGTDLAKYVEKKGPLPVARACHFIRQAALGLEHAHQHGMVHRDIKPHNLMLTSSVASAPGVLTVKVMDFGLARLARETASEAGLTGENALMGTADYIAPEQAVDAHRADIRADIYSLGCSLFHLLAGRPLLAGASSTQKLAAHLTGKLPLGELPAPVPAELRTVLAKMVAKDPAQRYQTPAEVAAALVPFIKKTTGVKPPAVPGSAGPVGGGSDGAAVDKAALFQTPPATPGPTLPGVESTRQQPFSRKERPPAAAETRPPAVATVPDRTHTKSTAGRRQQAGRWKWIIAGFGLVSAVVLLWSLWPRTKPGTVESLVPEQPRTSADPSRALAPLQVLNLSVKHFVNVDGKFYRPHGVVGKDSFDARCDDSVTVEATLSRPAYAYLISFRPDGTEELLFPENENEAPELTGAPRYPSKSRGANCGLNEGAGLQAFALVATSQPLPAYTTWRKKRGQSPWNKYAATPGVVWGDSAAAVEGLTQRGKGNEVKGKTEVASLADWLRAVPGMEAVSAVGFSVLPKEKP